MKALIIKIIFAENSEFSCCKSVGFKRQKTKTQSFDLFNIELNELFNIKTQALFESFRSHQEVEMSNVRRLRKKINFIKKIWRTQIQKWPWKKIFWKKNEYLSVLHRPWSSTHQFNTRPHLFTESFQHPKSVRSTPKTLQFNTKNLLVVLNWEVC